MVWVRVRFTLTIFLFAMERSNYTTEEARAFWELLWNSENNVAKAGNIWDPDAAMVLAVMPITWSPPRGKL